TLRNSAVEKSPPCRWSGESVSVERQEPKVVRKSPEKISSRCQQPNTKTKARAVVARHLRSHSLARFSLNINLPLEGSAVFDCDAVGRHVAIDHCRLPQLDSLGRADRAIDLSLNHYALRVHRRLDCP